MACMFAEKRIGRRGQLSNWRRESGSALPKVLVTLAVVAIVAAVAYVAVWQMRISAQQSELDAIAKEVFVVAQNHLSTAHEEGSLEASLEKGGENGSEKGEWFFVYNPGTPSSDANNPDNERSMIHLMLPFGSLDESVRTSGTYAICYNPETGVVKDVFYRDVSADDAGLAVGDYPDMLSALKGEDKAGDRRDVNGHVLGWYGGDDLGSKPIALDPLTLQADNGDRLRIVLKSTEKNSSMIPDPMGHAIVRLFVEGEKSGAVMWFDANDKRLWSGDNGGSVDGAGSAGSAGAGSAVGAANPNSPFTCDFVLDDATREDGRFAQMASKNPNRHGEFIPGENIVVHAVVTTDNSYATVAKSATVMTNSLFAGKSTYGGSKGASSESGNSTSRPPEPSNSKGENAKSDGAKSDGSKSEGAVPGGAGAAAAKAAVPYKGTVTSFRHLINLDGGKSGFDAPSFGASTVEIEQKTSLVWSDDENKGFAFDMGFTDADGNAKPLEPIAPVNKDGVAQYVLKYSGGATAPHRISDVAIDLQGSEGASADAGLFQSLSEEGDVVENLELLDFNVKTKSGYAGALVGKVGTGVRIANVLVRESVSDKETIAADGAEARVDSLQIAGATAGGLVGTMAGGTIDCCAAAVYVRAADGDAGGLVGSITGAATIANSYAAGHTSEGDYRVHAVENRPRQNGDGASLSGGSASAGEIVTAEDSTQAGRMNVIAAGSAGSAGGLVGSATGVSISSCYSTCSAYGPSNVGGLLGKTSGGSLANSYATGLVAQPAGTESADGHWMGAFIGSLEGGAKLAGNYYYAIVNRQEVLPVGNDNAIGVVMKRDRTTGEPKVARLKKDDRVMALDFDLDTYGDFMKTPQVGSNATPYDISLARLFGGKYGPKTIKELNTGLDLDGENAKGRFTDHLTTHYGDWPTPETVVGGATS